MSLYIKVKDFITINIFPVITQALSLLKNKSIHIIEKIKKTIIILKDGRGPPVVTKLKKRKEAHKKG